MLNIDNSGIARENASGIVNASSDSEDLHLIANAIGDHDSPMAINALQDPPLVNPELAPRSQLDFCGWVYDNYGIIFKRKIRPVGLKMIKTPRIEGLNIYGAWGFGGKYYGVWNSYDGRFIGWLWYSSGLSKIDHLFAIGIVEEKEIFGDMHDYCIRRKPFKVFTDALRFAMGRPEDDEARLGGAGPGLVRRGAAGHGKAWHGKGAV